jgi:hypothetical protein
MNLNCPFKKGDYITYNPSKKGEALEIMSSNLERLQKGKLYKVKEVSKNNYIVVDGHEHPGGGLYWTEFSYPKESASIKPQ